MVDLKEKNILICCNLKKERVLLFNYFDSNEAEMIYTAKDIDGCNEILNSENISCLLIECSDELIDNPKQLHNLIKSFPDLKIVLLINPEIEILSTIFVQFQQLANVILFCPFSKLEIDIKLPDLFLENNNSKINTLSEIDNVKPKIHDNSEDAIWDVFFNYSTQAKIIVDAGTQKIINVNENFLELFNIKEIDILDKSWSYIDDENNNYEHYIKELNSNDCIKFGIKFLRNKVFQYFNCKYQIGVLDGKIVFIGDISPEKIIGVSNAVYQNLQSINQLANNPENLIDRLDSVREYLNYSFVVFFEFQDGLLLKSLISGDNVAAEIFLENSMNSLYPIISSNKVIQIDKDKNKVSEYIEILVLNNLQTFSSYPVFFGDKTYGSIIVAGDNSIDSWQTSHVLFSAIVDQCKFKLFQQNIVQQREVEGRIDKLTGLRNRKAMTDKLEKVINEGIKANTYISLLIISVEKINYFNKNLGIEFTNQIIVNVANIIVKYVQKKGVVYRLSGDEFTVLLEPHEDKQVVKFLALKLIKGLSKPFVISNGDNIHINFNIGASIFPDDGQTVSSMMKNADLAMYDAKLSGRNKHVVFKYSETGRVLKQKIEMEENLRTALQNNHIHVFFQPKINAVTEDIVGFEALVRWIDPELGLINPGQFIPLAEETGLINQIGDFVTKKSCEMLVKWQQAYGMILYCSINLSAVQLLDEKLPNKLEKIINKSGVHPHYIDFEITETINLDDIPNLVKILNEIVDMGCTLSIDDFGTGHSSLDYVKRIPATYIKIDQSFVKNIGLNPEDEAILDATISIAKRLDRQLIAEGVETEEQREYLLERECNYFQGFLFAKPLHEEEIEKLLDQRVKLMGTS